MIAYKGFTPELTSRLGDGKKETCTFEPGCTMTSEESKTARTGYHCCENPAECLAYYSWDGKNRFWKVEAEGDIDEDAHERIACTKITLLAKETDKKLYFSINETERTLIVADNGNGIREDVIPMIFDEFFSMKSNGRGLGLYIVQELLMRIDAEIYVLKDERDKILPGANFIIKFNKEEK